MTKPQHENTPKLLQVTTIPITLNGFLLPFAAYFRQRGWTVDAMAYQASQCRECIAAFDHVWDVAWSRNPLDPRNLLAASRQVRQAVTAGQYDLVHVHTPVAAFVTRYALRNLRQSGKPRVIYTAHGFHFYRGGSPVKNFLFRNLEKLAGRWTDTLVVINREDEAAAKRLQLLPTEHIHYIPGIGVDTAWYVPSAVSDEEVETIRRELGLSADDALFLMMAGFDPGKRHRDLLTAMARLQRPDIHLALAGHGQLFEATQQLAADLRIERQVHFLGWRKDIRQLIRASIATCLPSEREGLARSVMESLCMEVPVIGTEARGVRDLLEEGPTLVKVGDVAGLAAAMAWVVDHPDQARLLGKRGRERMLQYDIQHVLIRYEHIYESLQSSVKTEENAPNSWQTPV